MRIPYVSDPPATATEEDAAIVSRVRARRAPRPLQPLDLALLHAPPVADGWNSFLGALRTRTGVAADVRELAICRVAVVNRAWYEWMHHAPLAVRAGVEETALEGVKKEGALAWEAKGEGLDERQWAALCYADEMTRKVEVEDATFERLRGYFTEREVVEFTAVVSAASSLVRPRSRAGRSMASRSWG